MQELLTKDEATAERQIEHLEHDLKVVQFEQDQNTNKEEEENPPERRIECLEQDMKLVQLTLQKCLPRDQTSQQLCQQFNNVNDDNDECARHQIGDYSAMTGGGSDSDISDIDMSKVDRDALKSVVSKLASKCDIHLQLTPHDNVDNINVASMMTALATILQWNVSQQSNRWSEIKNCAWRECGKVRRENQ